MGPVDRLAAQAPSELMRERAEFADWLERAPGSPFRALVQQPIGPGIRLGPVNADVVLVGVEARLEQRGGAVMLIVGGEGAGRPVGRDRLTPLGKYQLSVGGLPGQAVATVFGPDARAFVPPSHYPYGPTWRLTTTLTPADQPRAHRILAPDGVEVEATEAGSVTVSVGGKPITLRVFRIPTPGGEESELEVYFRDGTNGRGSYPAGRFVSLVPAGEGRYLLDFNRARNPFCAYSTVYPCPAPWRGNTIPVGIEAGEKYAGGGLSKPPG